MWGTEQGSKERFGQRGGVTWFGNEGLLRQRGLKAADTQKQGNTANKKSRSSMLEECFWRRGLVVLLAACSCDLHAAVICTLSIPNLPAFSPELEPSTERLPKPLSWTLSRNAD